MASAEQPVEGSSCYGKDLPFALEQDRRAGFMALLSMEQQHCGFYRDQPYSFARVCGTARLGAARGEWVRLPETSRHRASNALFAPPGDAAQENCGDTKQDFQKFIQIDAPV